LGLRFFRRHRDRSWTEWVIYKGPGAYEPLRCVRKDRMNSQTPLPRWIARLPADRRRIFAWSAFIGMVLVLPGIIAVLFFLLQSNDCSETRNGQMPFTCTPVGLATIKIVMAAILFPPVIKFLQLFKRILSSSESR
jgi:hypothetical protein